MAENRTALFSRKQPGGVWTVEDLREHPGAVWFVDSAVGVDSAGYGKNPDAPFATVDYAIGNCTASKGDVIYVMPGHAETCTAAVTMDVAGVSIIGLGRGKNRPALTASGAIDLITVTADDCHIENLRLLGASANVTALVNIAAADLSMEKLLFEPAATPLMTITVASGGHRFHLKDFKWIGSADGPDAFIDFESSASDDWIVEDGFINATNSGIDIAVFRAHEDTTAGGVIKNVVAIGVDAMFIDFNSSSAVGEGLIWDCACQTAGAVTATAVYDLGGYGMKNFGISDGANRAAILHPATSAT